MSIHVIKPGALSTLQDLGRLGYQRFGVSVNGAMDERSHRMANFLVGNPGAWPTLEITLTGPTLRFDVDVTIAISGADISPMLDGLPVDTGEAVLAERGSVLSFGERVYGARAYLAVRGGFAADTVLGSQSTNFRAGFGGFHGRALQKGDTLALAAPSVWPHDDEPLQAPRLAPAVWRAADSPIRVLEGREWERFTTTSHKHLLNEAYTVAAQSDRMGYRLSGAVLERAVTGDMWSETMPFGAVQVPPDGQPIILMTDRGTSGGYPRIANVVSVDLPRLAQKVPGDAIRFEMTTLEHAHQLYCNQADTFARMDELASQPARKRKQRSLI